MAEILVHDLDETAFRRLRLRANKRRIPLEQLIREPSMILARSTPDELWAEADRLRKAIGSIPGDSTELIGQDRDSR
jgi:hypothetical protein